MTKELKDIVSNSYRIFKRYKATIPLDACTACCLTKNQESELVTLSVHDIPFKLLYDYNTAAKTEKPSIEEFKHFLPRLLELTSELKFLHHSAELVLSQFQYYDKSEWTYEENELIKNFGQVFFSKCLTIYPIPELESIDSILIMLWETQIDIKSLLTEWTSIQTKESVLHFNDLVIRGFRSDRQNELVSSFGDQNLSNVLIGWIGKETTKHSFAEKIEKIILEPPADIEQMTLDELSWTYEKVRI
ncbi:MAG: hypothetical protein J7604_00930 [Sporocytophaga sp.]|uniref:hypothetical protein n=1 Tax=Sporocytophaga sp. TaxID=2231183 RepID=UPI001B122368|nr:hypothetical protein [Sporocytophaga sp.]MBO9698735.1 hypothetical protein [Sporocytophaga sp.]